MSTTLVGLKLTATELLALDQLLASGHYETRSAALRAGLLLLLDQHKLKREARSAIQVERLGHPMRRRRMTADEPSEGEG